MKEITSVAVVGLGALGMLFGEEMQRGGADVHFVADAARVARYRGESFTVNGAKQNFAMVADADAQPADLVIVAVKSTALDECLDTMRTSVGADTTILSVLNGITSEEIIGARYGMERVVYAVALQMDATKFGGALRYSKPGKLEIGAGPQLEPGRLDAVVRFFTRVGVPFSVEKDILYRVWAKFMLNCGINQCCMAYETTYGGVLDNPVYFKTLNDTMREVQALAAFEGVTLTDADREHYIALLRGLAPENMPSMRQDGIAHRPSEVELFSGTVCRMAAKHGLAVPMNEMLYDRIRRMEAAY